MNVSIRILALALTAALLGACTATVSPLAGSAPATSEPTDACYTFGPGVTPRLGMNDDCKPGGVPATTDGVPYSTVVGRVLDSSGRPVPRASITAERAVVAQRTTTSNEDGRYVASLLEPGPNSLTVYAVGFEPLVVDVDLIHGRTERDLVLKTAAPTWTPESGVPSEVDGRPVLVGDALTQHVAAATDDEPFLAGGVLGSVIAGCFVPDDFPKTPLIVPCDDGTILYPSGAARYADDPGVRVVIDGEPRTRDGLRWPQRGLVVLQVHVHDARARDCPAPYRERCDRAVVVDELVWAPPETQVPTPTPEPRPTPHGGVWPDGVPESVDGEVVLRGDELRKHLDRVDGPEPFLVGGTAGTGLDRCGESDPAPDAFFKPCSAEFDFVEHEPGGGPDVLFIDHGEIERPSGALVVRVHIHDRHAADCDAEIRDRCEDAAVLHEVVWREPKVTQVSGDPFKAAEMRFFAMGESCLTAAHADMDHELTRRMIERQAQALDGRNGLVPGGRAYIGTLRDAAAWFAGVELLEGAGFPLVLVPAGDGPLPTVDGVAPGDLIAHVLAPVILGDGRTAWAEHGSHVAAIPCLDGAGKTPRSSLEPWDYAGGPGSMVGEPEDSDGDGDTCAENCATPSP